MTPENSARIVAAWPELFQRADPRSPYAKFGFECGDGRTNLLVSLVQNLRLASEAHPTLAAFQIKEKLGGMRFFVENGSDVSKKEIDAAEDASYRICTVCGGPAEPAMSWGGPKCEECRHA